MRKPSMRQHSSTRDLRVGPISSRSGSRTGQSSAAPFVRWRKVVRLSTRRQREDSRLDTLTPRELEILGLIAEGRSNAAIADALVVTKRAVERHINAIFMKLELGDSEDVSRRVKAALVYLAGEVE